MIGLKMQVGPVQIKRLVYCKFLILQGKKYLENNTSEAFYNLSVILFANAIEIAVQTIALCIYGRDRTKEKISEVLKSLEKDYNLDTFAFNKVIDARNTIYHKANFHTWNTCKEIEGETEVSLQKSLVEMLDKNLDSISLFDLIEDINIKDSLREAEKQLVEKHYSAAVVSSIKGFAYLENRIVKRGYHLQSHIKHDLHWKSEISWVKEQKKFSDQPSFPAGTIFSKHIEEQVNKKIQSAVERVDVMVMMGNGYEDYKYMLSLVPHYFTFLDGTIEVVKEVADAMKYSAEQAEFVFNFVLRTVLEIEPKLKPIEIRSLDKKVVKTIN